MGKNLEESTDSWGEDVRHIIFLAAVLSIALVLMMI